jgi:hypothetical protein
VTRLGLYEGVIATRRLSVFLVLGLLFVPSPSDAKTVGRSTVRWSVSTSCEPFCPATTSAVLGGFGGFRGDALQSACEKTPYMVPAGSWQDVRVKVPTKVQGLKPVKLSLSASPTVDWDVFACLVVNASTYRFVATGTDFRPANCSLSAGGLGFYGCREHFLIPVKPGQTYVLRAYNRLDPSQTLVAAMSYDGIPIKRR